MDEEAAAQRPTFAEAFRFWVKLGFISFGGPAGQIAIMHTELVEKKKWIDEEHFLHALNYCMLLPGPEAQQLATYVGWLLHRTAGGIVAGAFFVIPSIFILWVLSYIYVVYGSVAWVAAVFYGLKPAVMAIVASAVLRIGRKALKNHAMWTLAFAAFVAIFFFKTPFPAIVLAAAAVGFVGGRRRSDLFVIIRGHGGPAAGDRDETAARAHTTPARSRNLRVIACCATLWWLPVLFLGWWRGWDDTLVHQGVFFSKAAMVTFGGAYAVLPYVGQQAVEHYHWLSAAQMMDGLGLAESTPGPLIMVPQFVGFLGGWNQPGGLPPLLAATLGAFITTWTTFLPCFLWIFLGAPYIERLRGNVTLTSMLSAVTAAVVGVVLNLAVWFGIHVVFPGAGEVDWFVVAVSVMVFLGMWKWKWEIVPVVAGGGVLGLIYRSIMGS